MKIGQWRGDFLSNTRSQSRLSLSRADPSPGTAVAATRIGGLVVSGERKLAVGSSGAQCLSMAPYVTGMGATHGATATGGRSC
jgi:hypothetical protein